MPVNTGPALPRTIIRRESLPPSRFLHDDRLPGSRASSGHIREEDELKFGSQSSLLSSNSGGNHHSSGKTINGTSFMQYWLPTPGGKLSWMKCFVWCWLLYTILFYRTRAGASTKCRKSPTRTKYSINDLMSSSRSTKFSPPWFTTLWTKMLNPSTNFPSPPTVRSYALHVDNGRNDRLFRNVNGRW